ncbi:hypothetical protein [Halocatena marina]|uniref:hypothetical protein n=1 Tax=Halocatena marina TaxID=2934937 RepID=UPI00200CCD71|nr:hypothetical protein [Halocatena marina]
MRLGVATISAEDLPVESVLALCSSLAVDGVEIWGGDHIGGGARNLCHRITVTAAASDIDATVFGSYLHFGS